MPQKEVRMNSRGIGLSGVVLLCTVILWVIGMSQNMQFRGNIVSLETYIASVFLPLQDVPDAWVETDPIRATLVDNELLDIDVVTTLDVATKKRETIWPARLYCPLLTEYGVASLDISFVGTIRLLDNEPFVCCDIAQFYLGYVGGSVVIKRDNNATVNSPSELYYTTEPVALHGVSTNVASWHFEDSELPRIESESGNELDMPERIPREDVSSDISRMVTIYPEFCPPNELLLYFALTDTAVQTSGLRGNFIISLTVTKDT